MTTEEYVREWLKKERQYTLEKFGLDQDDIHITEWNSETANEGKWWTDQLESYFYRAGLLELTNANGRQALAKFVATAVGMLEAAVRVYGPLPKPGVPSGENLRDFML